MKMSKRAAKALEGSIEKWKAIVAGTGEDFGDTNCPLCALYIDNDCKACPVVKSVGDIYCRSTPYNAWRVHAWGEHGEGKIQPGCRKCTRLAKEELAFLERLREQGES